VKILIVMLTLFLSTSCSKSTSEVEKVLVRHGCKEGTIKDYGWEFFGGCDKNDFFTNGFECEIKGEKVEGAVCSGIIKGYTVRWD